MRLYRPHIPLEVRCLVAAIQLGSTVFEERIFREEGESRGKFLARQLAALARKLGCEVKDLHLDHDPALAARHRKGEGKNTVYTPDANDPEFLIYREKHAHHIKTNVRGEGAQYPDRVLIKRERIRREGKKAKPKRKWPSRPFQTRAP